MRAVELTADEIDLLLHLLRGLQVNAADPQSVRVVASVQNVLKKLTTEPAKGE